MLSNFFFLVPCVRAFQYGHFTRCIIYLLIPFTSGSFHACDEGFACVFPFVVHRNLDYIFAIFIIPLTALYFVHWGDTWAPLERFLIVTFALLIGLLVSLGGTADSATTIGLGLVLFAAVAVPIIYWISYAANAYMQWPRPKYKCCQGTDYFPPYEWGAMLAGVSLTAIGIYLFLVQGTLVYQWSWVLHSMWHIMAAFGQDYILQIKAPEPHAVYRVLDADLNKITPSVVQAIYEHVPVDDAPIHIRIKHR